MQNISIVKLAPYWDTVIESGDEATSTLRIAFPTRDVAIVQILVPADTVEIISPVELPSAIVERARYAIRAYSQASEDPRSYWELPEEKQTTLDAVTKAQNKRIRPK